MLRELLQGLLESLDDCYAEVEEASADPYVKDQIDMYLRQAEESIRDALRELAESDC